MKILHLANWNSTNIGNGALIYGTQRVLAEDAPCPIEFVPEAWDDYTFKRKTFDSRFVELVNQHDALLINGAVTMNAFRRTMLHTGMRFDLPLSLWKEIECPIIFYGISYRCWPFQEYPNKQALAEAINYALSQDHIYFGVRNDGTKEWIRDRLGIESSKIHEVPDPGLFVPHEDHDYPELHSVRKNILIAFNGEDAPYRFATGFERAIIGLGQHFVNPARLERFVARFGSYKKERHRIILGMAAALERIARDMDVQFVLVPHYLDDYGMIQEFIEVLQERIAHQIVVSTGLVSVPHTAYFYGRYAKADLAISMRVHSMSPSIGLGIPVIPLTSQGRMRNFLSKIGLSDIGIDVKQEAFADLLAARTLEMLADPVTYTEHTKKIIIKVREESRVCNQDIFRMLPSV